MSLIMGAHPELMTTVIVQGSAADLAVPAEMSLTAPTIEFGPNRAADPSVSHTLASELGAWMVHLTEAQVAALSGLHYARLRVDDRIIAAGQVQHNPGWDGRTGSRASTSTVFGPEAVALLETAINGRAVRHDAAQALAGAAKTQARDNLGLGSAATAATGDFATAAQGAKADTAIQPAGLPTWTTISGKPVAVAAGATAKAARDSIAAAVRVGISLADYPVVADGVADDTAVLNAAATDARAGLPLNSRSRSLYIPADMLIRVDGVADLRYIMDVRVEGRIVVGPSGKILVGHSSNQRPGQRIYMREATWAGGGQTNVCVQAMGMLQAHLTIRKCSHLELLTDSTVDPTNDTAISYNTIDLGLITNLTLRGVGSGAWITQNTFIGGDVRNTKFIGSYPHGENLFLNTCVENGTIDLQTGANNRWINMRGEGGTQVTFAAGTYRNYLEDSYPSSIQSTGPSAIVVSDQGVENVVASTWSMHARSVELASIDAVTTAFDATWEYSGAGIIPGLDQVAGKSAWSWMLDSGIQPIQDSGATLPRETSWRMSRFMIASDVACFMPYVSLYDAAGNNITQGSMNTDAGWTWSSTESAYAVSSVNQASARIAITNAAVTHARIRVRIGSPSVPFRWVRVTGYIMQGSTPAGPEVWRRALRRPLYQAAKPTQGVAHPGVVVQGGATSWRSVARVDTTLTSAAATGGTVISVALATGIVAGDVIGVLMSNSRTHWTTVSSITGSDVTLAAALPADALSGAKVATTRWA